MYGDLHCHQHTAVTKNINRPAEWGRLTIYTIKSATESFCHVTSCILQQRILYNSFQLCSHPPLSRCFHTPQFHPHHRAAFITSCFSLLAAQLPVPPPSTQLHLRDDSLQAVWHQLCSLAVPAEANQSRVTERFVTDHNTKWIMSLFVSLGHFTKEQTRADAHWAKGLVSKCL